MDVDLPEFERRIGYTFQRRDLLTRAVTHKSYSHEARHENVRHNETFEVDSVALYRRIGIETIPNETTPFHIDLGMATQFTSVYLGRLLLVGLTAP